MGKKAQNPITFYGKDNNGEPFNVSIGRLWVGDKTIKPENMVKHVPIVCWTGTDEEPKILGVGKFDENHIIKGLKLLFPNGELEAGYFGKKEKEKE